MERIYLDYAASTPLDPMVLEAIKPYFSENFGNPSSLHIYGQRASRAVFLAREKIAAALGCSYEEIIFTASATEANNLALRGTVYGLGVAARIGNRFGFSALNAGDAIYESVQMQTPRLPFTPRVVVSAIEHESVLETCRDLQMDGVEVVFVPVNKNGLVDLKKIKDALDARTVLVSVMYANNEIGTVQPIAEIAKIIHDFKNYNLQTNNHLSSAAYPLFHTDAAQAFQYLPSKVRELGIDMMTISAHKIYGPKGAGALYVNSGSRGSEVGSQMKIRKQRENAGLRIASIITGGGQEGGVRAGTENVPAIVGFGEAVDLAMKLKAKEGLRVKKLCDYFWMALCKKFKNVRLNGSLKSRLPNNLNCFFPNIMAHEFLTALDILGVSASSGSACKARVAEASAVIKALGYSEWRALRSVRFSLGRGTSKQDIDAAVGVLGKILKKSD